MKVKPRARLVDAHFEQWDDATVLIGRCISHDGRPDLVGRIIHTSRVINYEGGIAETLNSIYDVELAGPSSTAPVQSD